MTEGMLDGRATSQVHPWAWHSLEADLGEFTTGPRAATPLPSRISLKLTNFGNRVPPHCVGPL